MRNRTEQASAMRSFEADLRAAIAGEVDFSRSARALFASDASNYRIVPVGVAFPRDRSDVVGALEVAGRHGVPVTQRGGGTSTGGQTVGPGLILDFSSHLDRVLEFDPVSATARVEPGIVLDRLQDRVALHGLRFGPDPSTHDRCTIGGMLGNNACGAHSMRWGKTDENVLSLSVVGGDGAIVELSTLDSLSRGTRPEERALYDALSGFVARHAEAIRTKMGPPMPRRVSGYSLAHLLPEHGGYLARALVGSEGTCAAIVDATLRLVRPPAARVLMVLGFSDLYEAADFVPELLFHETLTIEGLDARLVELARHTNESGGGARLLPGGKGWLLVEMGGDDPSDARARAEDLVQRIAAGPSAPTATIVADAAAQRAVWRLREDGAGLATRLPDGSEAWPGWEDAAVPPEHLGAYLRAFDALMADHGRQGMHYGHYGEGCMHVRIDFDFLSERGRVEFRRFIEDAADLVCSFGGSLSGEHGDGQARSELLQKMYPPEILEAFGEFKAIFDPKNLLNPGRIVAPRMLDQDLRVRVPVRVIDKAPRLALRADHGDLEVAARRCVGVGKCRRLDGGSMCPSFQVTRNEQDSTRGRARLLSEMFAGDFIEDGWRSTEVADALELCLSCKACKSDCPVGVDMAAYKAEFLSHHYARRLRPRSHYSLGYLPWLAPFASKVAPLVNAVLASPFGAAVKRIGGIEPRRALPRFARKSMQASRSLAPVSPTVVLWPDTFTNYFAPQVGRAAIAVLESLGERVLVPDGRLCCGLTWYSTGQLERARAAARAAVRQLSADPSLPIVVLEPSCASMLRDELAELLGDADEAESFSRRVVSFAERVERLLSDQDGGALRADLGQVVLQVHCHQRATSGSGADMALLERLGATVECETSCCGLAGNFGFERGHFDLSVEIAKRGVVGRLRSDRAERVVVADGFSCRTQIAELATVRPRHLAELVAQVLEANGVGERDTAPG